MLRLLGEIFMAILSFVTGSGLDRYIIENLFKEHPKKTDKKATYIKNELARRKPAKFSPCQWLFSWRDSTRKRLFEVAEDRISKEIDIVSFLRH